MLFSDYPPSFPQHKGVAENYTLMWVGTTVCCVASLRKHLDTLRKQKQLVEVDEPLSPKFEIAGLLHSSQHKPILFNNVKGSEIRVAANICPNKSHLAAALSIPEERLVDRIISAQSNPRQPETIDFNRRNWDVHGEADLTKLPILTHYERDKGPYITAAMVAARFPENGEENLSVQRMLPISRNEVVARVVPRHLLEILKRRGGEVEVAVSLGLHPAVFLGTSLQPAYGQGEYSIVNSLLDGSLQLMRCEEIDVRVPADAEIVLEGTLSANRTVEEGPFVDLTGTYDAIRTQPTIRFTKMRMKRDAIYPALLPAGEEHKLFMGLPQELKIWDYLKRSTPGVKKVHLTSGGAGYFHCIVSLDKSSEGDGKTAIVNCFAASHPLKLVIAVDSDIDPTRWEEVEAALATRFQADKGMVVIHGARGSSLDPSSGKSAVTSKLGLDATLPLNAEKASFEKGKVVINSKVEKLIKTIR